MPYKRVYLLNTLDFADDCMCMPAAVYDAKIAGVDTSNPYCKYNNQKLQTFTSILFLAGAQTILSDCRSPMFGTLIPALLLDQVPSHCTASQQGRHCFLSLLLHRSGCSIPSGMGDHKKGA